MVPEVLRSVPVGLESAAFENFLADMGSRPEGTTLGRFGDIGNYEPGNCEWQTPKQQGAEQRIKRQLRFLAVERPTVIRTPEKYAKGGAISGHLRWHVRRGISNPKCKLCQALVRGETTEYSHQQVQA